MSGKGSQRRQRFQAGLGDQAIAYPYRVQSGFFDTRPHSEDAVGIGRLFSPQQDSPRWKQHAELRVVFTHTSAYL